MEKNSSRKLLGHTLIEYHTLISEELGSVLSAQKQTHVRVGKPGISLVAEVLRSTVEEG